MSLDTALSLVEIACGAAAFAALWFVSAPYGRHARRGWGPTLPGRLGWVLMESPAALGFAGVFAAGSHATQLVPLVFLAIWELHYANRTFVYPLRMKEPRRMPAVIALMGAGFNALNASLNARQVSELETYAASWLADPRFVAGAVLFAAGLGANRHSDAVLRSLRAPGESGYRIPRGGLFRWVSCPNYLGELLEWTGWAIATWSLAGLAFALFTAGNLVPRAAANHRWLRATFAEYPPERRALVPYLF